MNDVYLLEFEGTDKIYIGSGTTIGERYYEHTNNMSKGRHCNYYMQDWFDNIGGEVTQHLLVSCETREEAYDIEYAMIDYFYENNWQLVFNIAYIKEGFQALNLPVNIIIEMYLNNMTMSAIANEFGCCPNTISNILKRNGIDIRAKTTTYSLSEEKEICRLYVVEKLTTKEIANMLERSFSGINKVLKRNNIKLRKSANAKRFTDIEEQEVCYLYITEKLSLQAISRKLNRSPSGIKKVLLRNGIKIRQ
jgi:IS30 family transposase